MPIVELHSRAPNIFPHTHTHTHTHTKPLQEALTSRVKQEILSELRTPDRLREALDVVEIVLGFLTSGAKADKPLGEYIDRMLKMKRRPFSSKVLYSKFNLDH